jgi:hypothetical protein
MTPESGTKKHETETAAAKLQTSWNWLCGGLQFLRTNGGILT